jgi:hypothetical protein
MDDKSRLALALKIAELDKLAAKYDRSSETAWDAAVTRGQALALRETLRADRARRTAA